MKNCFHQYGHQYCNHRYRKNATEFKVFQFKFFVQIRLPIVTAQNIALWD